MVGQWFKERFSLIKEDLANYSWEYKQWTQKVTAPSRRAYDYVVNQDFRDGNVEFEGDIEQEGETLYSKRKAYVVWYSGEDYGVRREISMDYWLSNKEPITEDIIKQKWMDKAIKDCLEHVGISDIENVWHGFSYAVSDSSYGELTNELAEYEYNFIKWNYTSKGRHIRDGFFSKKDV